MQKKKKKKIEKKKERKRKIGIGKQYFLSLLKIIIMVKIPFRVSPKVIKMQ